jgi:cytoskeletal protein RodZ
MARSDNRYRRDGEKSKLFVRVMRFFAVSLTALLTLETTVAAAGQQRTKPLPSSATVQARQLQDAPADVSSATNAQDALEASTDSLPSAPTPQPEQQTPAQQAPAQQPPAQPQETPQQPVGTAAAPYEKPTGVPGSRPAGAAIAPAKQRRVHAIVIRVAIVLAAGAAVGAVVGLSKATHSSPQ